MTAHSWALMIIAVAISLFISGVYGFFGSTLFLPMTGLSILALIGGLIMLLVATRPWHLTLLHFFVIGITILAIGLHAYEHLYLSAGDPATGLFLWSLLPYALCMVLSSFLGIRESVILGAAIALVFDLWGHYVVFINPDSSTASLVLLFIPLWSTIIIVPTSTFILWLLICWRRRRENGGFT